MKKTDAVNDGPWLYALLIAVVVSDIGLVVLLFAFAH